MSDSHGGETWLRLAALSMIASMVWNSELSAQSGYQPLPDGGKDEAKRAEDQDEGRIFRPDAPLSEAELKALGAPMVVRGIQPEPELHPSRVRARALEWQQVAWPPTGIEPQVVYPVLEGQTFAAPPADYETKAVFVPPDYSPLHELRVLGGDAPAADRRPGARFAWLTPRAHSNLRTRQSGGSWADVYDRFDPPLVGVRRSDTFRRWLQFLVSDEALRGRKVVSILHSHADRDEIGDAYFDYLDLKDRDGENARIVRWVILNECGDLGPAGYLPKRIEHVTGDAMSVDELAAVVKAAAPRRNVTPLTEIPFAARRMSGSIFTPYVRDASWKWAGAERSHDGRALSMRFLADAGDGPMGLTISVGPSGTLTVLDGEGLAELPLYGPPASFDDLPPESAFDENAPRRILPKRRLVLPPRDVPPSP